MSVIIHADDENDNQPRKRQRIPAETKADSAKNMVKRDWALTLPTVMIAKIMSFVGNVLLCASTFQRGYLVLPRNCRLAPMPSPETVEIPASMINWCFNSPSKVGFRMLVGFWRRTGFGQKTRSLLLGRDLYHGLSCDVSRPMFLSEDREICMGTFSCFPKLTSLNGYLHVRSIKYVLETGRYNFAHFEMAKVPSPFIRRRDANRTVSAARTLSQWLQETTSRLETLKLDSSTTRCETKESPFMSILARHSSLRKLHISTFVWNTRQDYVNLFRECRGLVNFRLRVRPETMLVQGEIASWMPPQDARQWEHFDIVDARVNEADLVAIAGPKLEFLQVWMFVWTAGEHDYDRTEENKYLEYKRLVPIFDKCTALRKIFILYSGNGPDRLSSRRFRTTLQSSHLSQTLQKCSGWLTRSAPSKLKRQFDLKMKAYETPVSTKILASMALKSNRERFTILDVCFDDSKDKKRQDRKVVHKRVCKALLNSNRWRHIYVPAFAGLKYDDNMNAITELRLPPLLISVKLLRHLVTKCKNLGYLGLHNDIVIPQMHPTVFSELLWMFRGKTVTLGSKQNVLLNNANLPKYDKVLLKHFGTAQTRPSRLELYCGVFTALSGQDLYDLFTQRASNHWTIPSSCLRWQGKFCICVTKKAAGDFVKLYPGGEFHIEDGSAKLFDSTFSGFYGVPIGFDQTAPLDYVLFGF